MKHKNRGMQPSKSEYNHERARLYTYVLPSLSQKTGAVARNIL